MLEAGAGWTNIEIISSNIPPWSGLLSVTMQDLRDLLYATQDAFTYTPEQLQFYLSLQWNTIRSPILFAVPSETGYNSGNSLIGGLSVALIHQCQHI